MKSKLFIFKKAYSVESPGHYYAALAVDENGIVKKTLGREQAAEIKKASPKNVEIVDFSDYYCLPGFFDSHTHFMQTGYNSMSVRFESCESIAAIKRLLAAKIKEKGILTGRKGLPPIVMGHGFDETNLAEKRMPERRDLDEVSGETPIFISRVDHHSCVCNSAFIELYKDFFKKIDSRSVKTGILRQEPNYKIKGMLIDDFSESVRDAAYVISENIALKAGITSVCALEGGAISGANDVYYIDRVIKSGRNRINIILFDQSGDFERAAELGFRRIGGCLLVDGSLGSATAALSSPYRNDPQNRGALYMDEKFMTAFIEKAQLNNLQAAFHAIGDRAINSLLNSYEKVLNKSGGIKNYLRHRIEHFELASAADIRRAAGLGIVLSMQPVFETLWGGKKGMYAERLGVSRALKSNRFASIIKSGAVIAGGSDSDVTPMSPLCGIDALLNLPNEGERVSVYDAVSIFTKNGAYANFLERERGTVAVNKAADFTILDKDIFEIGAAGLKDVKVAASVIGGEIKYLNGEMKFARGLLQKMDKNIMKR